MSYIKYILPKYLSIYCNTKSLYCISLSSVFGRDLVKKELDYRYNVMTKNVKELTDKQKENIKYGYKDKDKTGFVIVEDKNRKSIVIYNYILCIKSVKYRLIFELTNITKNHTNMEKIKDYVDIVMLIQYENNKYMYLYIYSDEIRIETFFSNDKIGELKNYQFDCDVTYSYFTGKKIFYYTMNSVEYIKKTDINKLGLDISDLDISDVDKISDIIYEIYCKVDYSHKLKLSNKKVIEFKLYDYYDDYDYYDINPSHKIIKYGDRYMPISVI